jgi:hypothetical protein
MDLSEKEKLTIKLQSIIKSHSLPVLAEKLTEYIKQ